MGTKKLPKDVDLATSVDVAAGFFSTPSNIASNKENIPVKILKTGLNVSKVIDEDTIKTDPDIKETIDDIISDYISTSDLVIPLINDISEMNNKPDGAIARCSWIKGVV